MKRFALFFLCAALILCPFSQACAEEHLEKLIDGQIVIIAADNGESYCADFFLSSVDEICRSGEDLIVRFGVGYIFLRGFFSDGRDARVLSFPDGQTVSGDDFAADGSFRGEYYSGAELQKNNQQTRIEAFQDPSARIDYSVRADHSGVTVLKDALAVYGEEKQRCLEKFEQLCGDSGELRRNGTIIELCLKDTDGELSAVRETVETPDGFTISCPLPECVSIRSSSELVPTGEGRTTVTFTNSQGEKLAQISVKVSETAELSCLCPCCGEETGGKLHLLSCGHYSCQPDFDPEEHRQAECHIAGHCVFSEQTHEKCKNCQKFLCDGRQHGLGYCEHVHLWQPIAYHPPADGVSASVTNRCVNCGAEYTEIFG